MLDGRASSWITTFLSDFVCFQWSVSSIGVFFFFSNMALPLRYPQASPTALGFFDTTLELFSPFSQREIFFMTWVVGFGWRGGIALADLLRALRDRGAFFYYNCTIGGNERFLKEAAIVLGLFCELTYRKLERCVAII